MNRIPLFDYEECYRYVPYCFVLRKRTQDHYLDLRRFVAINLLVIIQRYFLRKYTQVYVQNYIQCKTGPRTTSDLNNRAVVLSSTLDSVWEIREQSMKTVEM